MRTTTHSHFSRATFAALALAGLAVSVAAGAQGPAARVDTRGDIHPHVKAERDRSYVFRNRHLVAVLPRTERGYESLSVYPATRPTEVPAPAIAVAPALAQVSWREGETLHTGAFTATESRITGDDRLHLEGVVQEGGVSWSAEAELTIDSSPWLSWTVRVRPSAAAGLARFAPLPLRVGAEGPREAIFPGLEFLEGEEPSSSTADDHSPAHVRLVPDPYKITIPLMSLSQYGTTVALIWDNQQDWGGPGYPAALFDSPPRGIEGWSGRMELFLPSVPKFVHENEEVAAEPLALRAGQEVRLSGKIVVEPEQGDPTLAIHDWVNAYGLPKMAGYPRSLSTERRLCRQAYLPETGPPPGPDAAPAASESGRNVSPEPADRILALLMESGQLPQGKTRRELRARAFRELGELQGRGPLEPRLAYRAGGMLPSLRAERERVQEYMRTQLATGGWAWEPSSPDQAKLGFPGEAEVGTVTARALPILRFAAVSGDSSAAGAGLKALLYISNRFRVPRGARPSSVPLHAPDLLAAAEAAECFLLGYRIFGEDRFMAAARYWADAGLTFVYFWGERDRPALKHATIPYFGAAFYTEPAYGVASQWPGLVLARVLRELTRIRPEGLYDFVSEGILGSAMRQQFTTGEAAGFYPERWDVRASRPEGDRLPPDLMLRVLSAIEGLDVDVAHMRLRVGPDRMFVASGAMLLQGDTSAMRMRLKLHWLKGQDAFTTLTGVPARPLSVMYNTNPLRNLGIPVARNFLREVDDESERGWYYDPDLQLLVLRLRHTGGDDHLEIRWPDPKDRTPIDRIDTKIKPGRG